MTKRTFTFSLCLISFLTFLTFTYQKIRSKTTTDLVIIDESLQDYRTLAAGLAPGSQVIYVANSPEGFEELEQQLASHGKAERVHIMTHGTEGNFILGQTQLNGANIREHERFWQSLGNVLVAGKSNLLLYSCQLTATREGEGFVQRLHKMLGVPVAASNDQTGSERRGGDWDLEYVAGKIIKKHILNLLDFKGLLVPTFAQLTGGSSPFNAMTIFTDNQLIYGDFDADGDIDIHLYPGGNVNQFWQNNGSGSFARVTGAADPFEKINENAVFYAASNAFVADWDNDGDDDIYVPRRNGNTEKNFYYRNDNGKYELLSGDSSPFNGINISGDNQLIFGDFDVDGDIDLHSYPGSQLDNEFWRNNGSGAFSKVTGTENPFDGLAGKAAFSSAQFAYVADWDNDGDVDILVSQIGGTSVRNYYRNDAGVYSQQTEGANPFNGMVIASDNQIIFGDFDADGDIDLHTSDGSETLVFHRNNGSGVFTQVAGSGNPFNSLPNSGAFYNNSLRSFVADWDNDGDVDVFTTNYDGANQKYFFRQNDAPPRITATSPANTATGISVSSDISFTFDRAVTGAAGKYIQIRRLFDNAVFATIEANSAQVTGSGSNTITINPATDLEGGRAYYVVIDKAAFFDTEGRIFAGVGSDATWLRFTTGIPVVAPTVTTASASEIALTTANVGGEVTADGGAAVTERGIVWGTSTAPTTASNKVAIGSGTGSFSTTVTGLPAGTRVYLRAYAINSQGTSYGSEIDFYTQTSVTSITRQSANPTSDAAVTYQVVFAQSVTIEDASVFSLSTSGVSGASVSGVSGSGTTYDVTVNTGSGNGTVKLEVTGLTSTTPNLNAAFTTASAYTVYKVSNAGDYYRAAAANGTWTTPGDWQSSQDNSFWIAATSSPGAEAIETIIASGQSMRIPNGTNLDISNLAVSGELYAGDSELQIGGSFDNSGIIRGNATFYYSSFSNSGTLAPGESPGILRFTNNLDNAGTMLMEIGGTTAGTGYDQIEAAGFSAGGNLSVSFINGFTPLLGNAFVLINASEIAGTFETLTLPDIAPLVWETKYSDGQFIIRAVNDPMPVTLINFKASKSESAVDLVWNTSSEVNNSHFEIQRSAEGKVWENIGTVDRLDDNLVIRRYRFTDAMPLLSENFYRLRMVDNDGTFAFSEIEHVRFADNKTPIRSYPNPVTDKIFLDAANIESITSVEIYSASGALHYSGTYTRAGIDVKTFPAGIFIVRTTSSNREVSTSHFAKY
ncbi:hypothetical protein DYBT9623_04514 [Dyadobacter sp. CECT 9623]|uniref:FG-GAP repeat protein n=1 Tax=Dyadobacter linearis TaxID=2823330 RepID=A0ABN7RHZ7_9BACT|nr:DUF4347 domain-containing protein [Dyadobacter sp. CECT 9623]CAG5072982.1 hypothetical protein DYBT9623_04514 [Dyadobacter sp. CECT 9623]